MPEESIAHIRTVHTCQSALPKDQWASFASGSNVLTLESSTEHIVELQADVHSTAFLQWTFRAHQKTQIKIKVTYSEGYENEPRNYPFFRSKANRLDSKAGILVGPFDEIILDLSELQTITYEPFWFRTFRVLRLEISVGSGSVDLVSFEATQVNYPLTVKGSWNEQDDPDSENIWQVSLRTMRNCMFDGYSDCPFYEQLQ